MRRHLVRQGLDDWCRERALAQLRDHSVTRRKAAELADVSYVEMLTLAAEEVASMEGIAVTGASVILLAENDEGMTLHPKVYAQAQQKLREPGN